MPSDSEEALPLTDPVADEIERGFALTPDPKANERCVPKQRAKWKSINDGLGDLA
jgi:hypothetical protein